MVTWSFGWIAITVLWLAVSAAIGAFALQFGSAMVGEKVPVFGKALGVSLIASVASYVVSFPGGLALGCTVGLWSPWVSMILLTVLGIGITTFVYARMLPTTVGKGIGMALISWVVGIAAAYPLGWIRWLIGY